MKKNILSNNMSANGSKSSRNLTFTKQISLLIGLLLATVFVGQGVMGQTAAPSGVRLASSAVAGDLTTASGKNYEVFYFHPNNTASLTTLAIKAYNGTAVTVGPSTWCNIGSLVGNTSASTTAGTYGEYTITSSTRWARVRASNQANYQVVFQVEGYASVSAFYQTTATILFDIKVWDGSAYVASGLTGAEAANGSYFIRTATLNTASRYQITLYGPGTGTTNYNIKAFALEVPSGTPPTVTTQAVTDITTTTATGNGNVTALGTDVTAHGTCLKTSTGPIQTDNPVNNGAKAATGAYTTSITGLTANTLYYLKAFATGTGGTGLGGEVTFTTLPLAPTATAATGVGGTAFAANWTAPTQGAAAFTYEVQVDEDGGDWSTLVTNPTGISGLTSSISGLANSTAYQYRVRCNNAQGSGAWSNTITATTTSGASAPTVTTTTVSGITTTGASAGGNVTADGGASVTARGTAYATTAAPTTGTSDGTGTGAFTSSLAALTPNTLYYYRAYATNSVSTSYGNELQFTTVSNPASVAAATGVANTSFTANWTAPTGQGAASYTYTIEVTAVSGDYSYPEFTQAGIASGTLSQAVTGLTAGTNYWYRVTVVNAGGSSVVSGEQAVTTTSGGGTDYTYSNVESFEPASSSVWASGGTSVTSSTTGTWTLSGTSAVSSTKYNTGTVSLTLSTSATIITPNLPQGVNVLTFYTGASGGRTITVSTATTLGGTYTQVGSTIAQASTSGTTCNVHTVTINDVNARHIKIANGSGGSLYLDDVSITPACSAPTATTGSALSITTTSAILNGTVNANTLSTAVSFNHGATVSYGSTVAANETPVTGSTATAVTASISGLTANSLYHFRVSGTNACNTSNGNDASFTTLPNAPTIGVGSAATSTSITANWSAPTGGAVAYTYTVEIDDDIAFGSVNATATLIPSGTLSYQFTGLASSTPYYFRVAAVNVQGTSAWSGTSAVYSTTAPSIPSVTTQAVSSIAKTTASGNGTITSNGGSAILQSGVCWSTTSGAESILGSHTTDGGTSVAAFLSTITGLSANTTYYVKAYATNAQGTAYGTEVSFTTLPLSAACNITALSIPGQISSDIVGTNISVVMPAGTNVTALTPSVTTSLYANYSPVGARDFSSAQSYTVTAENGTTQVYTITVTLNTPALSLCADADYSFTVASWTASTTKAFEISGTSLESDISVSVDGPFQVSTNLGTSWATSGTVTRTGTTASQYVMVRYNPASGLLHSGTVVFSSTGATNQVDALTGVVNMPAAFYFRSVGQGAWDNLNTWETSADKITWSVATVLPSVTAAQIVVRDSVWIPGVTTASASNLRIEPFAKLLNNGTLNLSDSLVLESTTIVTGQIMNTGTITNTGVVKLEKTMLAASKWYFMSFPYNVAAVNIVDASTKAALVYGGTSITGADYAVARYDGFARDAAAAPNKTGSGVYWANETLPLDKNIGYIVRTAADRKIAFISAPGETDLFASSASVNVDKYITAVSANNRSWNLRGNPFTCTYDLDNASDDMAPYYVYNGSTYQTIMSTDSYILYPFTSFFLQAFGAGNTVVFNTAGQMLRAASAESVDYDEVELVIEKNGVAMDKVRIRINELSTTDFDPQIDGVKFLSPLATTPQIYSNYNGKTYSVNSLPATVGGPTTVPLSLYIPSTTDTYTIRMVDPSKVKRFSQVILTDSVNSVSKDLLLDQVYELPVTTTGTTSTRVAVILQESQTTATVQAGANKIKIRQDAGSISFTGLDSEASVQLLDASGRLIQSFKNVQNQEALTINVDGVYVVSVTTATQSFRTKIIVSRK